MREQIKALCLEDRHKTYGHRRIRALLKRRCGLSVARKTVARIMKDLGLQQERLRYKPVRPKRVERMKPDGPNQAWQVDMTSFQLADLTPLYLEVVVDCYSRKIVGWALDRRCRAKEWIAAVRMAVETQHLGPAERSCLVLRSDNGAQPCSKAFVEFLSSMGVRGRTNTTPGRRPTWPSTGTSSTTIRKGYTRRSTIERPLRWRPLGPP
ncbi:MAG: DDE-type integrase/transposase/recombinase [Acidobacteriota bacterium]